MPAPMYLLDPQMLEAMRASEQRRQDRLRARPPAVTAWAEDLPWEPNHYLRGDTWRYVDLFPELPAGRLEDRTHGATSPSGKYAYRKQILPAHTELRTMKGKAKGRVSFDSDVVSPALFDFHQSEWERWTPWMSLTPMEVWTLRPGNRYAKGHVVVTGLGLGHQLAAVCARKQVKRVTLVEISAELVDWLLPRIRKAYGIEREIDVIIGDARVELSKLTADVALLDHFPCYGNNGWSRDALAKASPGIGRCWAWGATEL